MIMRKTYWSWEKYSECGKIIVFIPRLAECSGQLSQAEKDREHWKLEYQLANIKLSKINNQVKITFILILVA